MAIARLELHYHLSDNAHSMDAFVRNKSEGEALSAFLHIAQQLGISVQLESSAYQEGGLKEIWGFIGANKDQLGWLLAIIVFLFSRFPATDPETDALNKEVLKLTIEEKKINLEKLKRELHSEPIKDATVGVAAQALESDLKVATRRSNFYRGLQAYSKVTAVGFTPIPNGAVQWPEEKTIARADFAKFIQLTDRLPIEVVDGAQIEIVAPVLKEGNYQWRGMFLGQPVSFAMLDEQFKSRVLERKISFQHGSTIECSLNIHRKFNEVGDIAITGYSVVTVISTFDGVTSEETPQGKRHKFARKQAENQGVLFNAPQ